MQSTRSAQTVDLLRSPGVDLRGTYEPVAASGHPLESWLLATDTSRQAPFDRVLGHGTSQQTLYGQMHFSQTHRLVGCNQRLDNGPLHHPVAEPSHHWLRDDRLTTRLTGAVRAGVQDSSQP